MNKIDIYQLRKESYLRLKSEYYKKLYDREVERTCLKKNFNIAKEILELCIFDGNHDEENIKILDAEKNSLKYCLENIKNIKKYNNELYILEKSYNKAKEKYRKDNIQFENMLNGINKSEFEEIHQDMVNTYKDYLILKKEVKES